VTGSAHDGVLVVEDDSEVREILVELLEDHGYRATAAANGLEALQRLRGDGFRPCVIILDLMMPVMDGATFWTEKQRDPALADIPVIVLSAHRHAFEEADLTGVKRFLAKPVDLHRLLGVVGEEC
jgi:CheY-like chemotaxis protein